MTSEVKIFPGQGTYDADAMLDAARNAGLEDVVIIGWDKDGELFFSSNQESKPMILWLLKQAESFLLDM